ncbi:cell adhesion molecule CEACAM3 isoform X2 [Danio rerio]|uniref:Cell adhesion molecule CEACAM3 isoform X2 n=1 Tax=Danio rerio TaxID=7955 RepID=A0AC58IGF7_DANRE
MKRISTFFQILLLTCSVFGADAEMKAVSVMEGDSVTLNPDQELQGIVLLLWKFGDNGSTIAHISGNKTSYPTKQKIFTDRLMLKETGSLTINNMRHNHSGRYKLEVDHSGGRLESSFFVTVDEPPLVFEAYQAERKSLTVTEGYPVILHTGITKLHGDELIVWRFGVEGKLLAKEDKEIKSPPYYDTDERFKGRLKLNDQTGSLTINNMKDTDAGLYTVKINNNKLTTYRDFTVTVSGSGLTSAAVAGIIIGLLMLFAVVAGSGFLYHRRMIAEQQKHMVKKIHTAERENVTLKTKTKLLEGDEIQWWFSNENFLIAEIIEGIGETYDGLDGRFSDILELDKKTGSLNIKNIRRKHTGDYRLKIIKRSRETSNFNFSVYIKEEKMIVSCGESVTLKADAEIQREDEVQWLFHIENDLIAKMTGNTREITYPDERFRDTLKMDEKTGSLTINNIGDEHTGLYKVKVISRGEATYKTFTVYINALINEKFIFDGRIGESVTLKPYIKIQRNNEIQWMIGDQDCLIAKMTRGARKITYHERFRDRLMLNEKTGSLTINNITIEDNRDYKLKIISSSGTTVKKFSVFIKGEPSFFCVGHTAVLQCAAEIQTDEIEWRFKGEESPIAEVKGGQIVPYNGPNRRFRDRLEVDKSNGSLIIKNIRREHEGLYKLKRKSSGTGDRVNAFTVTLCGSTGNQVKDSVTEKSPLLYEDDQNVVYENERMSSL